MGHQWTIGAFDTFFCHLFVIFQEKNDQVKENFRCGKTQEITFYATV